MNPDFKERLQLFNANHVEYLIIGGYAVIEYTEPRYTKDLDVWVHAEYENAERVFASLAQFGAPLGDIQYANLFQVFLKHKSVKVVTLWGINDGVSWRANGKPLLFDGNDQPKTAFDAVIRVANGKTPDSK